MIKDKALNDVMKSKMGELGGGLTIKIQVEPAEKQAEDDELQKQGLAPSNPEKDPEVKMVEKEEPEVDPDMADYFMSPDEQEEMLAMKEQGIKPKGIQGKAQQLMATKKIAKFSKDGNA